MYLQLSRTLHAFKSYRVEKIDCLPGIYYKDDKKYDIASGNWHYVYTVIQYGNFLLGTNVSLPVYDWVDDACSVKEKGMKLIEPQELVKICEAVIENITKLSDTENPAVEGEDWHLYESDGDNSFAEQKEELLCYAEKLLNLAKQGLYFVSEGD